jgi:Carboxypeptidase regulatory-like domain
VFGTIQGAVTDSTHLPVPNASLEILNEATAGGRWAVADVSGSFRVLGLPTATYQVRVNAAGFASYTHTGVVLSVGQTVRLDLAPITGTGLIADHRNIGSISAGCCSDQCDIHH